MIGQLLERLFVSIGADLSEFGAEMSKAATDTAKQTNKIKGSLEGLGPAAMAVSKKMAILGAGLTATLTAPLLAMGKASVEAAQESAQAMAQVTASLASMGPVAGRTAEQLQKQATALMHISTFDDDEILRSVTANLLTFGNIAGTAFDRAQLAAVNLATKLKTDLQSATILVGKALNDPVKGMAALGRAGIQFSEGQKETIKKLVETGQAAKAQDIILKELEKQFSGSAAAMRAATPGADIKNSWDDLQEMLGKLAIDVLPKILPPINNLIASFNSLSPGVQQAIAVTAVLAAAFGPVIVGISGLIAALATIGPPLVAAGAAVGGFALSLTGAVLPALGSLVVALAPILVPLAALAAAVAGVWYAWKNWDKIQPVLASTWSSVKSNVAEGISSAFEVGRKAVAFWLKVHVDAFNAIVSVAGQLYQGVKTWLQDKLGAVFNAVLHPIETVKRAFFHLYDAVVGHSYVPDMVDGIAAQFARLDGVMVKVAQGATSKTKDAFADLRDATGSLLDQLFPEQAQIRTLSDKYKALDEALAAKLIDPVTYSAARDRLKKEVAALEDQATLASFGDKGGQSLITPDVQARTDQSIDDIMGAIKNKLEDPMISSTQRIAEGFQRMTEDVTNSLGGLISSIKHGDVVGIIQGVANTILSIVNAISGIKSGFKIGSSSSFAPRAAGGPVKPYGQYLVGEHGPEILRMGQESGNITNNGEMRTILSKGTNGSGAVEVNIAVDGSPYFDARVLKVTRPGMVAAAQQGAIGGHSITTSESRRKASRRIPG